MPNPPCDVTLSLLVLRCRDVERAKAFYDAVGLTFVREQHGTGPVHFAAQVGETVLELYPGAPDPGVRLGFTVADLDVAVSAALAAGGTLQARHVDPASVVLIDPDGRRVVLEPPRAT